MYVSGHMKYLRRCVKCIIELISQDVGIQPKCEPIKKWNAHDILFSIPLKKTTTETRPKEVPLGEQLSPAQKQELTELVGQNQDVFSSEPGHTNLVQHHINTDRGKIVKLRPYRILEARRDAVRSEVKTMLEAGIIEESNSEWCSPIVCGPKPGVENPHP